MTFTLYFSFNLNTCTKVWAYVQHDLAIAGFLLRLKSICIKHSILNTTSTIRNLNYQLLFSYSLTASSASGVPIFPNAIAAE